MSKIEQIKAEVEKRLSVMPKSAWGTDELERLLFFIKSLENDQENELEEEVKRYVYDPYFDLNGVAIKGATAYLEVEDVANIARHFAEWQKEQMMKDAILTTMQMDDLDELVPTLTDMSSEYNIGDKVKVLIIKEE